MDYQFEIIETPVMPAISIRKFTAVGNLPQEIGKAYASIAAYIEELGIQPADVPFVAYYNMDMENLDVEMGFPISKVIEGKGEIAASEVPAGKKAVCMYKGSYQDMGPVYEAMTKWVAEKGYGTTGVAYEYYYNSPNDVPESELLTKVVFLLK